MFLTGDNIIYLKNVGKKKNSGYHLKKNISLLKKWKQVPQKSQLQVNIVYSYTGSGSYDPDCLHSETSKNVFDLRWAMPETFPKNRL